MKEFKELLDDFGDLSVNYWGTRFGPVPPVKLVECEHELLRRYELAQRARARNLVGRLEARADICLWSASHDWATKEHERLARIRSRRLRNRAYRIAAKYLGVKA